MANIALAIVKTTPGVAEDYPHVIDVEPQNEPEDCRGGGGGSKKHVGG